MLVIGYPVLILVIAPLMARRRSCSASSRSACSSSRGAATATLMARSLEAQARSQSYLVEMLAGMETLKAAAAEARAVERWSNLYVDELNVALDRGRLTARVDAFSGAAHHRRRRSRSSCSARSR